MKLGFWQERWTENRIGFHQVKGNAKLRRHYQEFTGWLRPGDKPWRVLVPLCGKTKDLTWLRAQGHEVIGVEFVEDAARQFFNEAGVTPERRELDVGTSYHHDGLSIMVADFFAVTPSVLGHIDMVYDRAALVAVEPELRAAYAAQLEALLKPGAGLFLITFEHDIGSGPPFSVENTGELFVRGFELERWAAEDILEEESRFRERGATIMQEVIWFARRR